METDLKKLLPLLLLVSLPAIAHAQFSFVVISNTVTLTRYIGGGGAVTIPGTIVDLPVTSIGDSAFSACTSVTSVTIPTNVTSIGAFAFENCTSLASITIPGGVTNIGSAAFGFCSSLTAIMVAAPNGAYSGVAGVLFDNLQTTLVEFPPGKGGAYTVPNSVTSIGDYAFYSCSSLTNVTMPGGLTNIGITAFAGCIGLTNITIPDTVTNIGDYAFANCTSLSNAFFLGDAPAIGPSAFSGDVNATVYYWSTNSGWASPFAGLPAITWNPVIISQPPTNLFSCPGRSWTLGITASGKAPLAYQWRQNGTNLTDTDARFGSMTAQLTLSNLTELAVGLYDVVVTNSAGSVTSTVTALAISSAPARATPILSNGFVVGATLLDGGCGYTNTPIITFVGSSGTGASGYGQISNGSVTNIVITAAGSGYSADTTLHVGPPFYPVLILGSSETTPPSGAATPVVVNGFIVGANLTSPGAGYDSPPSVSFADVSGQGAAATAQIGNGSITNILITIAGSGYSSNALINIAPPPDMMALTLSASNLIAGQTYQLQNATNLSDWTPLGAPFSPPQPTSPLLTNFWTAVTNNDQTYFRLQLAP